MMKNTFGLNNIMINLKRLLTKLFQDDDLI